MPNVLMGKRDGGERTQTLLDTRYSTVLNKINTVVLTEYCLLKFTVIHYTAYVDSMSKTASQNTMKDIVILFA